MLDGDSNSKFFYAYATTRKRRSKISNLKNEDGVLVSDHGEMCSVVKNYFTTLFCHDRIVQRDQMESGEAVVTEEQNKKLVEEFSYEEFTNAIKEMHLDKSAGPDGLNPAFYQNFWHLMGREVFTCCKSWLRDMSFPANLNDTMVVLIQKKEGTYSMKDFRPIELCNVLYKIIAKVLSNRLREILPGIITENQFAFVPGRNITDNVLVAFEMLHYMKQKTQRAE